MKRRAFIDTFKPCRVDFLSVSEYRFFSHGLLEMDLGAILKLPHWVGTEIESLPAEFTGQIVLEVWRGGVTRVDTKTSRQAPKVGGPKLDDRK